MGPQPIPQPDQLADATPREGGGVMSTWRFRLRVRVYQGIDAEIPDVMKFVNETTAKLEGDGRNSIVRVNDGDEQRWRRQREQHPRLSLRNRDTCSGCDEVVAQTTTGDSRLARQVFGAASTRSTRCNRLAWNLLSWGGRLRPVEEHAGHLPPRSVL